MEIFFKDTLVALSDAGVKFVVGGGVALVLQGVERFTADLDVSVERSEENLRRFLKVMGLLSLKPSVPVSSEVLLDPAQIAAMIREKNALVFTFVDVDRPYRRVDFFISETLSYERLHKGSVVISLGESKVEVCSPKLLLDLKLEIDPPRDKDLFDIKQLRKINESR